MKAFKYLTLVTLTLFSSVAFGSDGEFTALLIEQIGKFHPIVLHFPVVFGSLLPLLLVLTHFEFGKIWRPTIPYFIHLGAISAVGVAALGLMWSLSMTPLAGHLYWHRLLGLIATGLMVLISVYVLMTKPDYSKPAPKTLIALSLITAGVLAFAGHMGGESVHGDFIILFNGL